jgi:polysaccharide deacetylase 2 family uncharacterized protein YibQ
MNRHLLLDLKLAQGSASLAFSRAVSGARASGLPLGICSSR